MLGTWSFRFVLWYILFLFTQPHFRFPFLIPFHIGDIFIGGGVVMHFLDRMGSARPILRFGVASKLACTLLALALITHYFNPMQRTSAWNVDIDGMVKVAIVVVILEAQIDNLYKAVCISGTLALGTLWWIKGGMRLAAADATWGSQDRLMGANVSIIKNPNDFAYLTVFMIPLYFYFYRVVPYKPIKFLCLALMGAASYIAVETGSRTGLIAMMVMGAGLFPLIMREEKRLLLGAVAFVLILFGVMASSGNIQRFLSLKESILVLFEKQEYYSDQVSTADAESASSRVIKMKAAWGLICDYPILGVGTKPYPRVYIGRPDAGGSIHNEILMAGRHMGFPGMILYGLAIYLPWRMGRRIYKMARETWPQVADLGYCGAVQMTVIAVGGFFSPSLFNFPHMMMLASLSSTYYFLVRMIGEQAPEPQGLPMDLQPTPA